MARSTPRYYSLFGPGGCCDACGHPNWDMGCEGIQCYRCKRGIFMHRRFWRYLFDGEEFICATPSDDVDEATVHQEWRALAANRVRGRYVVQGPLLDALHSAGEHGWDSYADSSAYGVRAE